MSKFFRAASLAALAIAAVSTAASAQATKSFGAVAGVDFATISGSDFNNTGSKTGFMGGLYYSIPASHALAIEPEVLYVNKGASDNNSSLKIGNNYIEIPVLLKYNFSANGGPYILAGPEVAFSVSCNLSDGSTSVSCDNFGLSTKTTFGGVFGLGYQKNKFGLEGRFDFDFGDAFDDVGGGSVAGKNQVWAILVRYQIK